jgi:hypothetical protein
MFPVQPQTVRGLFEAQTEANRGKLRLDISSQTCPSDPTSPCDLPAAQVAVAERFLRSLAGYVDEIAAGWPDDEKHREPQPIWVMRIYSNKQVLYPDPLNAILCRVFGLQSPRVDALQLLGSDFYRWLKDREAEKNLEPLGIRLSRQSRYEDVEVLGFPYESIDHRLDEADLRSPGATPFVRNGKWQW